MSATQKSVPTPAVGVVNEIALADLAPDSGQPRRSFDAGELEALSESIRLRGVMQPILARSMGAGVPVMIVDGERRWRAAKLAKLQTVPVILVEQAESLQQLRVDQVVVNELRTRLKPLELGFVLKQLRDESKLSHNDIAAYFKKNGLGALAKQEVENLIGLTELPEWAHKMVNAGDVEVKAIAQLKRFAENNAVLKEVEKNLGNAVRWGGQATVDEVNDAIGEALFDVGHDLGRKFGSDPVLFDWKQKCKGCPFLVQHAGGAFCMDKKLFAQHQAEAKEAGLGPGGEKPKTTKSGAVDRGPTKSEVREKTEQRKRSLGGKATEYLHAYLMRAMLVSLHEVAPHLMMFAALKRPNCYGNDWCQRGAPACHYPDGRESPVEKLGSMKAAQDHKIVALENVLDKKPTAKAWDAIVMSIAHETLFELPWRETQVLAHHMLGDDISKIWKLEPAFLDLFRKTELVHLAKKYKVPLQANGSNLETGKASELKAELLKHPGHLRAPQILADLYKRIDKPDRNFD